MNLTYHGVPRRYYESLDPAQPYTPPEFAQEGFIHCTDGRQAVSIILTLIYRKSGEEFVVLAIDKDRVAAPIKYEDPGRIYPHIYGPLNRDAIVAVYPVERSPEGTFHMPPVPWTLRDAAEADDPQLVEIVNRHRFTPMALEEFRRHAAKGRERGQYRRLVAVDAAGEVMGHGSISINPWRPSHARWVAISVHPLARRQGVGKAILAGLEQQAREWGATLLDAEIRDDLPDSLRFAEAMGFAVADRSFPSSLNLERFDPEPYRSAVSRAEAEGYRFITMADVDPEEGARKLYDLELATNMDEPGLLEEGQSMPVSFEQYCKDIIHVPLFDPRGVTVAVKDGQWVACNGLHFPPEKQEASIFYTCVLREHRGKGLAQAVKVLGSEYAKAKGYTSIITGNNERNAPMLAINRKLGFEPKAGIYRITKAL